jgi:uncharacterized membrane protein
MIYKKFYGVVAGMIAALIFTSFAAIAQENITRPAYFRVIGVAANDVLNVRISPDASAQTIGSLAYNAFPIEVFQIEGNWAEVALPEGMGWVSAHFLEEISMPVIGESALPDGLACGGTEPFWNLEMAGGQIAYSALGQDDASFAIFDSGQFANVGGTVSFVLAQTSGAQLTGIVSDQLCSDGMSDRTYPRRIELLLSSPDGTIGLSGCCNVSVVQ